MSVQKTGRGTWVVRWREEGRHRSRTFHDRDTARTFDIETRKRLKAGAFADPEPSALPLADWVEVWFRRFGHGWARKTRTNRGQVFDHWVIPYIGDVRLRDLGRPRVREFLAQIVRDGASENRHNVVKQELSACLGAAVLDGLLPDNPVMGIRRLRHRASGRRAWPPIIFERIRAQMAERDALAVSLMYLAGLRPSEAIALTWGQVRERTLLIDRAAPEGKTQPTKTGYEGTVEICGPLHDDLVAARPQRARAGDPVIRGRQGDGVLDLKTWREKRWRPAVQAAGLDHDPPHPYDGRHTFGSLLIREGRNILEVQRALRHARSEMTLRHYAHEIEEWRGRPKITLEQAVYAARRDLAHERARRPVAKHAALLHAPPRDGRGVGSVGDTPAAPAAGSVAAAGAPVDTGGLGAETGDPCATFVPTTPEGGSVPEDAISTGDQVLGRDGRYWARTSDPQLVDLDCGVEAGRDGSAGDGTSSSETPSDADADGDDPDPPRQAEVPRMCHARSWIHIPREHARRLGSGLLLAARVPTRQAPSWRHRSAT